jgi:hypothetical protein
MVKTVSPRAERPRQRHVRARYYHFMPEKLGILSFYAGINFQFMLENLL